MSNTTTTQIVREDPEIEKYRLGLLKSARELADKPVGLPQYQVSGLTGLQDLAAQRAESGVGAFIPFVQAGSDAITAGQTQIQQGAMPALASATFSMEGAQPLLTQAANLGDLTRALPYQYQQLSQAALQGTGSQFDPNQISAYMSPYEDAAVQQAMADLARQGDIARQGVAAQAVGQGAFGGSRSAIAEQELNRNVMEQMGRTAGQMRQAGFESAAQRAQQGFESAMGRQQAAAGQLGQLGLQYGQLGQQDIAQLSSLAGQQAALGQGLGALAGQAGQLGAQLGTMGLQQASLGELQAKLGQSDIDTLMGVGGMQYQQAQAALEAQRQSELQKAYEPYQRVSFLSDIYSKTPSAQQTLSVGTSPAVSPFQQIAGLGIAGLSAAGGAAKAGLFG